MRYTMRMADIPGFRQILRRSQLGFRAEYAVMMGNLSAQIGGILTDFANMEGRIPNREREMVLRQAGDVVIRIFVGQDGRSPFGQDGVTALAPYPDLLNRYLAGVQYEVIRTHNEYIRRRLPRSIFDWLANGLPREPIIAEIDAEEIARRAALRAIFVSTENLQYDPAHFFVSPDGYTLSDRIWLTGQRTRDALDRVLAGGIRDARGALQLARDVERMLVPGQVYPRTTGRRILSIIPEFRRDQIPTELRNLYSRRIDQKTPTLQRVYWSRRVSANGMRLARTEITAAFGNAMKASSLVNPFVEKIQWLLSPSHPLIDICDAYHLMEYDPRNVPQYPAHPNCLCILVPVVRNRDRVVRELREIIEEPRSGVRPYVNTADLKGFTDHLLGDLSSYLPQGLLTERIGG